jgi:hypothetical protein
MIMDGLTIRFASVPSWVIVIIFPEVPGAVIVIVASLVLVEIFSNAVTVILSSPLPLDALKVSQAGIPEILQVVFVVISKSALLPFALPSPSDVIETDKNGVAFLCVNVTKSVKPPPVTVTVAVRVVFREVFSSAMTVMVLLFDPEVILY